MNKQRPGAVCADHRPTCFQLVQLVLAGKRRRRYCRGKSDESRNNNYGVRGWFVELAHIETKGKGVYFQWDHTERTGVKVEVDDDCTGSSHRRRDDSQVLAKKNTFLYGFMVNVCSAFCARHSNVIFQRIIGGAGGKVRGINIFWEALMENRHPSNS